MLSFDTTGYLERHAPNLSPLRPAIDTWAAMHAIHPRVLIPVLQGYWPVAATSGTDSEKEIVHQIATGLAQVYLRNSSDPLAASKAVMAIADAYHSTLELPQGLASSREIPDPSVPTSFGWFQPPFTMGDTWAGGGAHGDTGTGIRNALDYWGEWRLWDADLSAFWVAAMQEGTARVWSECSVSVIHAEGWVTTYYHLENIQLADQQAVERNTVISNYANDLPTALCQGGSSSGPHVHSALYHNGDRVEIDEANVDFTAFSHHAGVGQYDFDCSTSWYNHSTL
jgi:LasA protease